MDFFNKVGNVFNVIATDYLYLVIAVVVIMVIFCVIAIFKTASKKKLQEEEEKQQYKKEIENSLSDEEIEKIANNVSNPDHLYDTFAKKSDAQEEQPIKSETDTKEQTNDTPQDEPKKAPKKAKSTTSQEDAKPQQKQGYSGKWIITVENKQYIAKLAASNGGILLKTEPYASLSGAKNGITTIRKNIENGNFATSVDKNGKYKFKLYSMSNRFLCQSEEYSSKAKCENGINSVKRFAKSETIVIEEKE